MIFPLIIIKSLSRPHMNNSLLCTKPKSPVRRYVLLLGYLPISTIWRGMLLGCIVHAKVSICFGWTTHPYFANFVFPAATNFFSISSSLPFVCTISTCISNSSFRGTPHPTKTFLFSLSPPAVLLSSRTTTL